MTAERRLKMELGTRDEDVRNDASTGGLFHRSRHLRGWSKWMHGHTCPRCGASCHDRPDRELHDSWHRDDDEAWQDWADELGSVTARIVKLEGQIELMTELLGPALDRVLQEREPA